MADEETPETTEENAPEPEAAAPAADATEAPEPAAEEAPAEEPAAAPTKRQARAAAKQAASSQRPARTPEERQAERLEERKRKAAQRRRRRVKERAKAKEKPKATEPAIAVHAATTGRPKTRDGRVVSDKADQTITVRIETARRHRRYEKIVRSSSTLHAHDAGNDAHEGDLVRVVEARPLSKTKRWRLVEVLERAR
jgi:small subunit ribosomal protein S17